MAQKEHQQSISYIIRWYIYIIIIIIIIIIICITKIYIAHMPNSKISRQIESEAHEKVNLTNV